MYHNYDTCPHILINYYFSKIYLSMLLRQSKNTFIRTTKKYGYITNQMTRMDRCYDENGALWLKEIKRYPRRIPEIINNLKNNYEEVDLLQLQNDFMDFIKSLEKHKFVITGETIEEIEDKDRNFSYSMDNPKTLIDNYTQFTEENITQNTQKVFFDAIKETSTIVNLQFELSSRCNERCIHCYIPNEKKNNGEDLPSEKVMELIDEYANMGGIHITFSGGEAFLHKDLINLVQYSRKKDMKVSILSNLLSITDKQINALKDLNISLVQTSLYSMDPKKHDFITTVKGSLERTKSSIEKLVKADIPVQISCPIMKANFEGYEEVLEYAKSLKIKAECDYIIMAQSDLNTNNLANRLNLDETEKLLRTIIENDIDYREVTLQQLPITDRIKYDLENYLKEPVCGVGYDNCCISANGDVYPCSGWGGYVLGNVYKQPLKEIWLNSKKANELRSITKASFPQCIKCEARNYCSSCLVRNFNESGGDMFAVNKHFCDVAFLTKRLVEEYKANGFL